MKKTRLTVFVILFVFNIFYVDDAGAGIISQRTVKIRQMRIYQGDISKEGLVQSYRWGVTSNYFGPDDIKKLVSVDIFIDRDGRIETLKVIRKESSGKLMISIFRGVTEFSLETTADDSSLSSQEVPITIRTIDDLVIP